MSHQIRRAFACLGVLFLASSGIAKEYKVVLLGGQSNMDGRGFQSELPSELQAPQQNVRFFYDDIPNNDKANFTIPAAWGSLGPRSTRATMFGPEITFGKTWAAAHPGESLALIKYARGGTTLWRDWVPRKLTPDYRTDYQLFRKTATTGLNLLTAEGDTYTVIGMLWLQGESDADRNGINQHASAYQRNLTAFIADIRATYGANLPFVIGGNGYSGANYVKVAAAQQAIATTLSGVAYFDNSDLNGRSSLHFDAADQQEIGVRYALALAMLTPEPEVASIVLVGSLGLLSTSRSGAYRQGVAEAAAAPVVTRADILFKP